MLAMKKGSEALKGIHTSLYVFYQCFFYQCPWNMSGILIISNVDKVDQTMDSIREQMDLTNEISDAISNPVGMGNQVDEVSPSAFRCPDLDQSVVCEHTLTSRTSSRRNSKRSNRRNWTTDLQAQNEHLYTPRPPQSESPQDENVCIPAFLTVHFYAVGARAKADNQAWLRDKRKMMKKLNCDNCKLNWPCNFISSPSFRDHVPIV
jgi:hypothetical protein